MSNFKAQSEDTQSSKQEPKSPFAVIPMAIELTESAAPSEKDMDLSEDANPSENDMNVDLDKSANLSDNDANVDMDKSANLSENDATVDIDKSAKLSENDANLDMDKSADPSESDAKANRSKRNLDVNPSEKQRSSPQSGRNLIVIPSDRRLKHGSVRSMSSFYSDDDMLVSNIPSFFWDDDVFRTYRMRFGQLFIYILLTIANQMYWVTFAPITSITSVYYNVDASLINLVALTYSIFTLPGTLLFSYLKMKSGMRVSLLVSFCL